MKQRMDRAILWGMSRRRSRLVRSWHICTKENFVTIHIRAGGWLKPTVALQGPYGIWRLGSLLPHSLPLPGLCTCPSPCPGISVACSQPPPGSHRIHTHPLGCDKPFLAPHSHSFTCSNVLPNPHHQLTQCSFTMCLSVKIKYQMGRDYIFITSVPPPGPRTVPSTQQILKKSS